MVDHPLRHEKLIKRCVKSINPKGVELGARENAKNSLTILSVPLLEKRKVTLIQKNTEATLEQFADCRLILIP